MRKPMPSPRGTNYERLFISSGPAAAYDAIGGLSPAEYGRRMAHKLTARRGMAFDLELPEEDENVRQKELDEGDAETEASIIALTTWCKQNLSEKDISRVINQLIDHNGAMDEPTDFPGRPRTGGTKAMDARRRREMTTAEKRRLDEFWFPACRA
jgi:hypothetical protein